MEGGWPKDVGILGMEIYFPMQYVSMTDLESFDDVSEGKYTVGLGQLNMGLCSDREDVNSMCLSVVDNLMAKYQVSYSEVGRLEVGSETIIDKSKSIKTVLMTLFEDSGNSDVEGVDSSNACYGGTAALFNCISWIESSYWDGRFAIAVCADVAVYPPGNARSTGGAGAVAMLIGPNAPLVFDRGLRATHVQHVYDFYKPNLSSEYPVVDGKLSIGCYLRSLDRCFLLYCDKAEKLNSSKSKVTLDFFDAILFHTPFCKLVQKSLARLALLDCYREINCDNEKNDKYVEVKEILRSKALEETYFDREIEKKILSLTKVEFEKKTSPSLWLASNIGNMYTASLYASLVSFLCREKDLKGKKLGMFSYGSGLVASFFSLTVKDGPGLNVLLKNLSDVEERLQSRERISPVLFSTRMSDRESNYGVAPFQPKGDLNEIFNNSWYLDKIDEHHRRSYKKKAEKTINGHC